MLRRPVSEERLPKTRTPPPDSSRGDPVPPEQQIFFCDLCGTQMLNLHCKLICERCGYKRDCSDP